MEHQTDNLIDSSIDIMNIGEQPLINHDRRPHGKTHEAFLQDIVEHRNKLKEFHMRMNKSKLPEFDTPAEQNLFTIKSYKDWLQYNSLEEQDELINDIINTIKDSPMQWRVNFESLTNYGRAKLQDALIDLLQNIVAPQINARDKYYFNYRVSDDKGTNWVKVPLKPGTFQALINRLKDGGLVFNMDDRPPEYFYEQGHPELPYWSLFSEISLAKGKMNSGYTDRGGSFFPYWNKTYIDLRKYQIFAREDNYFERRACIEVPCAIWSLRGLIPDDKLNAAALRLKRVNPIGLNEIITNYHNNKDLDYLCRELHIHCKLHYYDENTTKPQFRIIDRGVDENIAEYHIELALYKEHYFKYEMTEYSKYFIKNYKELEWVENGNKVVGKRKSGTYQRDSREKYYLNSLELVIEMMSQDMFSSINFQDLYALTLEISPDTPITEIPLLEDCEDWHDTSVGLGIEDKICGYQLWSSSDESDDYSEALAHSDSDY